MHLFDRALQRVATISVKLGEILAFATYACVGALILIHPVAVGTLGFFFCCLQQCNFNSILTTVSTSSVLLLFFKLWSPSKYMKLTL
jgi:hypothetical protein